MAKSLSTEQETHRGGDPSFVYQVVERFDAAWQAALAGKEDVPRIEAYLSGASETNRLPLLIELLTVDVERRLKRQEKVTAGDYATRFPEAVGLLTSLGLRFTQTLTITQFFERLRASEILSPEDANALWKRIPQDKLRVDAERLIPKLIEAKKLTPYQVAALLAGQEATLVLGDYVILQKIGQGGMGQVFKARHRRMKRVVALKILPPAVTEGREAVLRFQREVEVAARLTHPNIVASHDAGEEKGTHFLVMEYVEGSNLSEYVKVNGPLPAETAIAFTMQAARGLAHAHANGVIHRDIKPSNLLLDQRGIVKVLDMGLARLDPTLSGVPVETLTDTGKMMGTIDYMSPEQALDTKRADVRSDIYSLGCTLYYLLTGRTMYEGDTAMKRILAHREMAPPALSSAHGDLPPGLFAVFERMVAKKPEERYLSMDDVSGELLGASNAPSLVRELLASGELSGAADQGGLFGISEPKTPRLQSPGANTIAGQENLHTLNQTPAAPAPWLKRPVAEQVVEVPAPLPKVGMWRQLKNRFTQFDELLGRLAGEQNSRQHEALRFACFSVIFFVCGVVGIAIVALVCMAMFSLASLIGRPANQPSSPTAPGNQSSSSQPSTPADSPSGAPSGGAPAVPSNTPGAPGALNPGGTGFQIHGRSNWQALIQHSH